MASLSAFARRSARSLPAFIREQKPDLLWLLVSSWATPVLHRVIPELGIPCHITVHDLSDSAGLGRSMGAARAARFQKMVDELYAGAVSRDVYTQEMGDEIKALLSWGTSSCFAEFNG